jgi:hypothetical protein
MELEMSKYETFSIPLKDADVLDWWRKHQDILPLLSKVASKVLVIPSSSAKSERDFSTGGNVVTVKRGSLDQGMVEDLIVIHENLKLLREFERFTDEKEKNSEQEDAFNKVALVDNSGDTIIIDEPSESDLD